MKQKITQTVLSRSKGLCEICQSNDRVQLHHIIGGRGKRRECETVESVIALCYGHHYGSAGAHGKNGHNFSITLKRQLQQKYFGMGFKEDTVRRLMGGKLYD